VATTTGDSTSRVDLVRLPEVDVDDVLALLNEHRLRRHMPLSSDMTRDEAAAWVAGKDAQWEEHGYGPWAVLVDRTFAGWAGFQAEDGAADLAVVLRPEHWGRGLEVAVACLDLGFGELGLDAVVIALPLTRSPTRVVARLGFAPDGEVEHGGATFRRYRLTRQAWTRRSPGKAR
jgi:[ribosomal protein S5]-alanine N-acetyltransferase